jgi:hypothetical protein
MPTDFFLIINTFVSYEMDFAKISNYTIEIYFVPFYFGQRLYIIDFRYFRKCHHFENISFELGVVDYSQLPIFILI